MEEFSTNMKWKPEEGELENLTPIKARDLMVDCFYDAQKEIFACVGEKHSEDEISDETLKRMVIDGIMTVCQEVGVDYNQPTKEGLERVADSLAFHAAIWGTPEDVVKYHHGEVMNILNKL